MRKNPNINKHMNYYCEDFTEEHYEDLVKTIKAHYTCIFYDQHRSLGNKALLKHDIDLSPHRSYAMAQIEAGAGVYATYFIRLHGQFYNAIEKAITDVILKIIQLGHEIGLHFEPEYYDNQNLHNHIKFEKEFLETLFGREIKVLSFHNPAFDNELYNEDVVSGLINTYSPFFSRNYAYCSDSNGYWRYKRLENFLEEKHDNIHVLTHPAWWVPEVMSPAQRVDRCIQGRAISQQKKYDEMLKCMGRENVGRQNN